jgi:hypothetical protein
VRRIPAAVLLTWILVGALVVPVAAAPKPPTPVVTVSATVFSIDSVSIVVDVAKPSRQVTGCTYQIDEEDGAPCGTKTSVGTKATRYTISRTQQNPGDHTVTASVTIGKTTSTGSASFTVTLEPPPAPEVFALAFTNLDGVAGYDQVADALIARLIDDDRSLTVSVNDVVEIGTFPTDFAGGRTAATVISYMVTGVGTVSASEVTVTSLGGATFRWVREDVTDPIVGFTAITESYLEAAASGASTYVVDGNRVLPQEASCTLVEVVTTSPSQPETGAPFFSRACNIYSDDPIIDTVIDAP